MRLNLPLLVLGLLFAVPGWAQLPPDCPPDVRVPLTLEVPNPCPGEPLFLVARACGPCTQLLGWTAEPLQIAAQVDLRPCIEICIPESLLVPIGTFAAGHFALTVQIYARVTQPDSSICISIQKQLVTFDVPLRCPPPTPGPLPYVEAIHVGPPPPCAGCPPPPICPQASIPFAMAGVLPDDCHQFRGLELLPDPRVGPGPQPPMARAIIAVNDCLGRPCLEVPSRWDAHALLPGLPPGSYGMIVQVAEVSWCDTSNTPKNLYSTVVPFTVADSCDSVPPPVSACFLPGWARPSGSRCNAGVNPSSPAHLTFQLESSVALAGLQARFTLEPPGLKITDIQPLGPATGMHLAWTPRSDGASFVLFADSGAPIPATLPPCAEGGPCGPVVLLDVTASAIPGTPIPPVTRVHTGLLGADSLGRGVAQCPTFAEIVAGICLTAPCDANGDAAADVRDLVLMAHCVMGTGPCPDSSAQLDCNHDGTRTLDDVLCCALTILHGTLPESTAARQAPDVRVALGSPVMTAGGFDLPVRLEGAGLLGAARLQFTHPQAYRCLSVELLGAPPSWMHVEEAGAESDLVGLIGLGSGGGPSELSLLLHFGLPAGQTPPGEVWLSAAEFAGTDGVALIPSASLAAVTIGGPPRLELSAVRPNPFAREARIDLDVTGRADVELGIYDLSGRLVAELFHGRLEPGVRTFTWDGTRQDGTRAADGVYFYRAKGAGRIVTRRLVLLRGR